MKTPAKRYVHLTRELARVDFKIKYQGSVLGYLWTLVKPLALFGVLYVIFTKFVKIGANVPHYPIYLLLGIVLWSYFAESTTTAMRSIVDRQDVIRKVSFPKITLLLASNVSATITLLLNLLAVFVFAILSHTPLGGLNMLLLVPLMLELFILTLGVSALLATLFTRYRDVGHIWEVGLQMLFYASAILFPLSVVPEKYQKLLALNPITQIVQDARHFFINSGSTITSRDLLGSLSPLPYIIPLILLAIGVWLFSASAKKFAEQV